MPERPLLVMIASLALVVAGCDKLTPDVVPGSPDAISCKPSCQDRVCGDDGCGGTCGTCGAGTACDATLGTCTPCTPNCGTATCGSDGCGGTCGTCREGESCNALKRQCIPACQPACSGRECGEDTCGGSCGTCPGGKSCVDGACVADATDVIEPSDPGPAHDGVTPDGTVTTCTSSAECAAGTVCQAGRCVERLCYGTADCNGGDLCVDGSAIGKDPAKRFCTAPQCDTSKPCAGGHDCLGGLCIPATTSDVIENDARDTIAEDAPPADPGHDTVVPPPPPVNCKSCTGNADCGSGARCLPVGASKHCLSDCTDDGDCPGGYVCYNASTASKGCLPVSFECQACAFDEPCGSGKVCDFVSGACKDGKAVCEACTYDFDCKAGLRCLKESGSPTGTCVAECGDARPCADSASFVCGASDRGVMLCQPRDPDTCGAGCSGGLTRCASDGQCHECCRNADCAGLEGASGTCTDFVCDSIDDPCQGSCIPPFPVCVTIGGSPQCVQCAKDSDCAGMGGDGCTCSGDPTYSCLTESGETCGVSTCSATCMTDADCPPDSSGGELLCSGPGGFCYNAKGTCDNQSACCPAGTSCYDIMSALGGTGLPGSPGAPSALGYCSCDDTHACLNGNPCSSTDTFCTPPLGDFLCPGGTKPATMPDSLCVDIQEVLAGILGGI